MSNFESMDYNQLAQKYISIYDNLKGLEHDIAEIAEGGEQVPQDLKDECKIYRDNAIAMINIARDNFQKTPAQLYEDGWKFWMEEDKEMREERYGKPEEPKERQMTLVYFPDMEEPLEVAQIMEYQEFKKITGKNAPVEFVRLPNPAGYSGAPQMVAIINEEGLLEQLPLNRGNLVGNIIIAMIDPEDEEEIRGFLYHEEIKYAKMIMDHYFPRATEETEYPDPTPQFFSLDDEEFKEYMKTGKLPNQD